MDLKAFMKMYNPSQTNLEVVSSEDNRDPFMNRRTKNLKKITRDRYLDRFWL